MPDGASFVAVFSKRAANATDPRTTHVQFESMGLPAIACCRVRDLWARKDLGEFESGFDAQVAGHCARMFRVVVVTHHAATLSNTTSVV